MIPKPNRNKATLLFGILAGIFIIFLLAKCIGGGITGSAINYIEIQNGWGCSSSQQNGYTKFNGTIKNVSGEYDLKNIELRGTVFEADGPTVINTDTSYIDSDIVYRNQTSTFSIMVSNSLPGSMTRCKIAVENADFVK
jgi:hypothetical protein